MQIVESVYFCNITFNRKIPLYARLIPLVTRHMERYLEENPKIEAVLITSPTYDGVVSDVRQIAEAAHKHGIPLIVDEAHGAHFRFSDYFPVSATDLGADVVIQSFQKHCRP